MLQIIVRSEVVFGATTKVKDVEAQTQAAEKRVRRALEAAGFIVGEVKAYAVKDVAVHTRGE